MNNYVLALIIALVGIPLIYGAYKLDKYFTKKELENSEE